MAGSGAQSIGRTLTRLAALSPRPKPSTATIPSQSRPQILALIQQSEAPVSVEHLCERTGLHANTVRGHLDVLLAAGGVHRQPGEKQGRGRPPWLYAAGPEELGVYDELAQALLQQLGAVVDPGLVDDAAQRWAEAVLPVEAAGSPDEAVQQAAVALAHLGFTAEIVPVGDAITLGNCPYASLVADQPVICDIHTALLAELLAHSGQDVTVAEMDVWARPGLCLARLNRPDLEPARTITPTDPQPAARRPRRKPR